MQQSGLRLWFHRWSVPVELAGDVPEGSVHSRASAGRFSTVETGHLSVAVVEWQWMALWHRRAVLLPTGQQLLPDAIYPVTSPFPVPSANLALLWHESALADSVAILSERGHLLQSLPAICFPLQIPVRQSVFELPFC